MSTFMQFGLTALHHAALSGQVDSIRVLVQELQADPNIGDLNVSFHANLCQHPCIYTALYYVII